MLKNITLSAEKSLIDSARQRAREKKISLNTAFRQWLGQFAKERENMDGFRALMDQMAEVDSGGPFGRAEMNER